MRYFSFCSILLIGLSKISFAGVGYAGSPAPEVTTVQGISGGTSLPVTATIQTVNNSLTNQIISNNAPSLVVNYPNADEQLLRAIEANTRAMLQDEPESSQKQGFEIN